MLEVRSVAYPQVVSSLASMVDTVDFHQFVTNYHNELNKSDANIIGHVLDKNTEEHLSFISVSLKGTTIGTA